MKKPTYKPEYCQMLIDHMSKGYSFESFAGKIGRGVRTIYEWREKFEEFQDACSAGFGRAQEYH